MQIEIRCLDFVIAATKERFLNIQYLDMTGGGGGESFSYPMY